MRNMKKFSMIAIIMVISAVAFAGTTAPTRVNIELVEGYSTSFRVQPTAKILSFLETYGINNSLGAAEFGRKIGQLDLVAVEEDADTGEVVMTAGSELIMLVNSALMTVNNGSEDPYYMDLGSIRWIVKY